MEEVAALGCARQVDPSNWAVIDREGRPIGIIWRVDDGSGRFRCAPTSGRGVSGIEHSSFEIVLDHALRSFAPR
jgi:hypothetical protein